MHRIGELPRVFPEQTTGRSIDSLNAISTRDIKNAVMGQRCNLIRTRRQGPAPNGSQQMGVVNVDCCEGREAKRIAVAAPTKPIPISRVLQHRCAHGGKARHALCIELHSDAVSIVVIRRAAVG